MTFFVLAQHLSISLHVEKNEKGTTIRGKKNGKSRKLSVLFFQFKFVAFLVLEKNIQKHQKLLGHF